MVHQLFRDTIRGMLRGHFVLISALCSILTAILTNEALPGVVIVIMQSGGKALEDYALRRAHRLSMLC